jgi:hypothetical protein
MKILKRGFAALVATVKSFGWTIPGAMKTRPEEPQVPQVLSKPKTTRNKKETI